MAQKRKSSHKTIVKHYEIVPNEYSLWGVPQNLITLQNDTIVCPKCSDTLRKDYTLIPISNNWNVKKYGKYCYTCKCLYINYPNEIVRFLKDRPMAKGFTLDGKELWCYSALKEQERKQKREKKIIEKRQKQNRFFLQKARKRLSGINSACMIIAVRFEDKTIGEFVVVNNKNDEDITNNIYYYASQDCREILSAAFEIKRNHRGTLNGKSFKVINSATYNGICNSAPDSIAPAYLYIKRGGGFISSVKNNNYELVDMLLYSPFTARYEIIRATYDKREFEYYTDAGNYRRFVNQYGNPQIDVLSSTCYRNFGGFEDLNTESILHEFGYNVNKSDGLSSAQRHGILSDLVDLEILKVEKIVEYLDWFIKTHTSSCYFEARCKWEFDKKYIMNYKANPSRFLIANNEL